MKLVNTRSADWLEVVKYAQQRIEQLMEEAISISATDEDRRDAASRVDELRALLSAPGEAIREQEPPAKGRSMY